MPRKGVTVSPQAAEKNKKAIARWKKENVETISFQVRKGERDRYKALAARRGKSLNGLIRELLDAEDKKGAP